MERGDKFHVYRGLRHQLISALEEREGRVVPFKFVNHGVDVWRQ